MGYCLEIIDPKTAKVIEVNKPHGIYGSIYCNEETELVLNITYNYCKLFKELFGEEGIYILHEKTSIECMNLVQNAIQKCVEIYEVINFNNLDTNYWDATPSNVYKALISIFNLLTLGPYGKVMIE